MTEIIGKVQKQAVSSALISLYEVTLSDSDTVYFYNGLDENLQSVEFDGNTYLPLPILSEGFDIESGGMYSRPTITIGNVTSVFSDSLLEGQSFEDLISKRITRRTTLAEYLGIASSIEFPSTVYVIDRIKEKSAIAVTLELSVPFDLQGIKLPFRVVLKDTCPWRYKEATNDSEASGCTWCSNFHTIDNTYSYSATDIYINRNNEYIVYNADISAINWATSPTTVIGNYYYTTNNSVFLVGADGSLSEVNIDMYWQALVAGATDDPSHDSPEWRLVHVLKDYNASADIYKYRDSRHSTYVLYSGEVWQAKLLTQLADNHISAPFGGSKYWTRGDQCGKSIQSCKLRFHAAPSAYGDDPEQTTDAR